MATELEDLRILQVAESIADRVWQITLGWDRYARSVVGGQLARAADSVGANIAESYGRYHYGEKIRFLYIARGSLFETKYWLNRAVQRQLLPKNLGTQLAAELSDVARQLNIFVTELRRQQHLSKEKPTTLRENSAPYQTVNESNEPPFLTEQELAYLANLSVSQSPSLQSSSHPTSDT